MIKFLFKSRRKNNPDAGCADYKKCFEILELMLDDEATPDQEKFMRNNLEKCILCFEHLKLEKEIKDLIRNRLEMKNPPSGLVKTIRDSVITPADLN
ncbi:MAG TPA: anti-sigma factor [Cyclobacteriaceae bacterium]